MEQPWQHPAALLHIALPILCIFAFGRSAPKRGFAWCIVAGVAVYQAAIILPLLILGHLEILFPIYFRSALLSVAGVALGFTLLSVPSLFRSLAAIRYRPKFVDILILVSVALFLRINFWEIRNDWNDGATTFDSLAYHIPRVIMWSWHGNFHPYQTAIWHQIGYVVGGSGTVLPLALMGRGWLGGAWTGLMMAWGAIAAVFVIARTFNLSVRASLLGALCLAACPVVGMRLSDISTDICAAFPVLAGTVLFLTLPQLHRGIFYFIVLSGIGVASKQYVAFPVIVIALVLFIPRTKEILFSKKVMLHLFGGVIAAAAICLLSFFPVYEGFGSISGGNEALVLISWNHGWGEIRRVTIKMFFNWLLEPLSVVHLLERINYVPERFSERFFDALGLAPLYTSKWLSNHDVWYPIFTPFNNRSGFIPLLLLPWLIMSVKRGRRWLVTGLFVLLYISQTSILVTNYWAARFVIIMLAAFSLLWASRAEKNPIIVALFVMIGMFGEYLYVQKYRWEYIPYSPNREHLRDAAPYLKDGEFIWVISTSLTNDGNWNGKLGQFRFEYTICPADGDWVTHLKKLQERSRWIMLPANGEDLRPGPSWESLVTHECPNEKVPKMKERLTAAGWTYKLTLPGLYELWTTDPGATPVAAVVQ
jgi:hypothetical protein